MILITQTNGRKIRGEIETDLGDEIVFDSEVGRLIIKKSDIAEEKEILDCTEFPLGTYIKTGDAIYVKINNYRFRLIRSSDVDYVHPIDVDRIDFGEILTHDQVFPPEQPEVTE